MSEKLGPPCGDIYTIPFRLDIIDCIVLGTENGRLRITYWLSGGECHVHTFAHNDDAGIAWTTISDDLEGQGFVGGEDVFLRAEGLRELKKLHTPELGHHIHFIFHGEFETTWKYPDEASLDNELSRIITLFATLQEKRATGHLSSTKQ